MPDSKGQTSTSKVQKALGIRQKSSSRSTHAPPSGTAHDNAPADHGPEEEDWWERLPRQLELAISSLSSQIITSSGLLLPPIVLKNHLRRTADGGSMLGGEEDLSLEQDLDQMQRDNKIRCFRVHLPPSFAEEALMTTQDYHTALLRAASHADESGTEQFSSDLHEVMARGLHTKVVEAFIGQILPRHVSTSISSSDLLDDLKEVQKKPDHDPEPELTVSTLMQLGALSRSPKDHTTYLFSIPGLGQLLSYIRKGREEVMGILGARQHKELMVSELLKVTLRKSRLSVTWHLHDLVSLGSGVVRVKGPNGRYMIKILNDSRTKKRKAGGGEV